MSSSSQSKDERACADDINCDDFRLRSPGDLCVNDGHVLTANRERLASKNDFFQRLLFGEFRESEQTEVVVNGVSINAMRLLLKYVDEEPITVDNANLPELLHAASYLLFEEVQQICANYMVEKADDTNCIEFMGLAERYNLACFDEILLYVLENFVPVSLRAEFHSIEFAILIKLLSDDRLIASSEIQVVHAVCRWLTTNKIELAEKLDDIVCQLFFLIRYEQMTYAEKSEACCSFDCWPTLQAKLATSEWPASVRMRDEHPLMCILRSNIGRDLDSENLSALGIQGATTEKFTACIEAGYSYMGGQVAVVNGFLYVAGYDADIAEHSYKPTAKMSRYDLVEKEWVELCPMLDPRELFVLVSHTPDTLVAIGGRSTDSNALERCEYYNIVSNRWYSFPPLPSAVRSNAGCSHQSRYGMCNLYISGGKVNANKHSTNSLMSFEMHKWSEKKPMIYARSNHVMVAHKNRLIVCGGIDNSMLSYATVEMYNINYDYWTEVKTSIAPLKYSWPSAIVYASKLYVSEDNSDTVHCYDLQGDVFTQLSLNKGLPRATRDDCA